MLRSRWQDVERVRHLLGASGTGPGSQNPIVPTPEPSNQFRGENKDKQGGQAGKRLWESVLADNALKGDV